MLYIFTIFNHPKQHDDGISHLLAHRILCMLTFISLLLLLVFHAVPGVAYTYITHLSPPQLHSQPYFPAIRTVALLFPFLVAGLMRRGPRLRFTPLSLGTGFGINATKTDTSPGGDAIRGSVKPGDSDVELQPRSDYIRAQDDVMDYANSPMLSFVFLAYVSLPTPHLPSANSRWLDWRLDQ